MLRPCTEQDSRRTPMDRQAGRKEPWPRSWGLSCLLPSAASGRFLVPSDIHGGLHGREDRGLGPVQAGSSARGPYSALSTSTWRTSKPVEPRCWHGWTLFATRVHSVGFFFFFRKAFHPFLHPTNWCSFSSPGWTTTSSRKPSFNSRGRSPSCRLPLPPRTSPSWYLLH